MSDRFISDAQDWADQVSLQQREDDEVIRADRAKRGSPFLSTEQAASYLGLSSRTLQIMRATGVGPAFRRHSRFVRYHIDDLDSWSGPLHVTLRHG